MNSNTEKTTITSSDLILNIKELSGEYDGALKHALDAQIEVFKVFEDPTTLPTCVDSVLQSLLNGIETAETEEELRLLKKDSSLLIQSLLFMSQSKLIENTAANRKKVLGLLTKSVDCAIDFALIAAPVMAGKGKAITKVNKLVGSLNLFMRNNSNNKESFIESLGGLIFSLFKAKENKEKYFQAIDLIYEKFFRYQDLLGTSILLAENVRNNAQEIIKFNVKKDKKELANFKKKTESMMVKRPAIISSSIVLFITVLIHIILIMVDFATDSNESHMLMYLAPLATYLLVYFYFNKRKNDTIKELSKMETMINEKESSYKDKYNTIAAALTPSLA